MSGLFTVYPSIKTLGVLYLLVSVAAMIVAHDAHFYWSHRLLHHRLLFSRFHRAHHKSVTPTTFACLAFHEGEAFVQGLFLPLWLIVVPMQLAGLIIALTLMLVRTALGHSGVELFPARVAGRWLVTNTHHDLHHMTGHHNYGLYFTFWDRLMSTEHPTSERKAGATVPISLGA